MTHHAPAPQPRTRLWIAAGALGVAVVVAACVAMALGDAISVEPTARPSVEASVVRSLPTWPTPAPVMPTDLDAPSYGPETSASPLSADLRPQEPVTVYRDRPGPTRTVTGPTTTVTATVTAVATQTVVQTATETSTATVTETVTALPELPEEEEKP